MKACKRYRDLFIEALYGELDQSKTEALETHLDQCHACRKEFREMRQTLDVMSRKETADPGKSFWNNYYNNLQDRMHKEQQSAEKKKAGGQNVYTMFSHMPGWAYQLAGAAAMLLIGVLIGYLYFGQKTEIKKDTQMIAQQPGASARQAALSQKTAGYFERTKVLLLGFINLDTESIDPASFDFSSQRNYSADLIRETAVLKNDLQNSKDRRAVQLLSELEKIFLQIKNLENDEDLSGVELIQHSVDNQAIMLKINLEALMLGANAETDSTRTKDKNNVSI